MAVRKGMGQVTVGTLNTGRSPSVRLGEQNGGDSPPTRLPTSRVLLPTPRPSEARSTPMVATFRPALWMTTSRGEHRNMLYKRHFVRFVWTGSRGASISHGPRGRAGARTDRRAVPGLKRDATATRPGRPFGTPKSADAPEDLSILAQSLDTRTGPVS